MLLEGIFLPLTTPFNADGRLFLHKLASNVEHYSRTQASGFLVLGGAGEPDSLNNDEARSVLSAVAKTSTKEKVLLAGAGRGSVRGTLEMADFAAQAGYDAIAIRAPEFCGQGSMEDAVMTYFRAVADRSPLPVVVLADRDRQLGVEVIGALADHPQIIGAIDSAASPERCGVVREMTSNISYEVTVTTIFAAVTRRMLGTTEPVAAGSLVSAASLGGSAAVSSAVIAAPIKTRTRRVGFQYLAGSAREMLEPWKAGAVGAVPRLGAAAPQACCEVWQAFKDGDDALAAEKQARIQSVGERVESWAALPALKYACDLNGYFGGHARLPLLSCRAEDRAAIDKEMAGLKN